MSKSTSIWRSTSRSKPFKRYTSVRSKSIQRSKPFRKSKPNSWAILVSSSKIDLRSTKVPFTFLRCSNFHDPHSRLSGTYQRIPLVVLSIYIRTEQVWSIIKSLWDFLESLSPCWWILMMLNGPGTEYKMEGTLVTEPSLSIKSIRAGRHRFHEIQTHKKIQPMAPLAIWWIAEWIIQSRAIRKFPLALWSVYFTNSGCMVEKSTDTLGWERFSCRVFEDYQENKSGEGYTGTAVVPDQNVYCWSLISVIIHHSSVCPFELHAVLSTIIGYSKICRWKEKNPVTSKLGVMPLP